MLAIAVASSGPIIQGSGVFSSRQTAAPALPTSNDKAWWAAKVVVAGFMAFGKLIFVVG